KRLNHLGGLVVERLLDLVYLLRCVVVARDRTARSARWSSASSTFPTRASARYWNRETAPTGAALHSSFSSVGGGSAARVSRARCNPGLRLNNASESILKCSLTQAAMSI